MSRRLNRFVRLTLSGFAALCAFSVVITSKPAVTPASAAPDRLTPAQLRPIVETAVERGWSQVQRGPADPRVRLLLLKR